ncbi:DNA-directed RNA polymerase subunit alpha [Candidatus Peregrinibacteria bacterium]|jgi:DNA-directed RNA polymerase subunit alpha|nr:DNA-directed RNA polymerase subunit alpha [Candidatus Peregrinibacteria bacterium]
MHIIHEEIGLPKISTISQEGYLGIFSIEPLPAGYGMTLGNTLRRVLLSSLPGTAIIAVRIEGATHEYTTVKGMKDSVLDFILNLKGVDFQKQSKGQETLILEAKGDGPVKASQIKGTTETEILNPDYVITHLSGKDAHLKVEIIVEKSVGYLPAKKQMQSDDLSEFILTDALFSPVKHVRYDVEATRVGENTDLDKLVIEIETNEVISPEDALKFSANVLTSYFSLFDKDEAKVEEEFMSDFSKVSKNDEDEEEREAYTPIEILNFSPRTLNALINGDVGSIEQLTKCTPAKLQSLRGFGKKAMDEVDDALEKRNLQLNGE